MPRLTTCTLFGMLFLAMSIPLLLDASAQAQPAASKDAAIQKGQPSDQAAPTSKEPTTPHFWWIVTGIATFILLVIALVVSARNPQDPYIRG
jgi:hypothetical protein